jgi:hypothetical protein
MMYFIFEERTRNKMQCPSNKTLLYSQCFSACPVGTIPFTQNETLCVSTLSCPASTTQDLEPNICNKNYLTPPVNGVCPIGQTQWIPGQCLINCNLSYFLEEGSSCMKKTIPRTSSNPSCYPSFLLSFNSIDCVLSATGFFFIAVVFLIFAAIAYFMWKKSKCYFY